MKGTNVFMLAVSLCVSLPGVSLSESHMNSSEKIDRGRQIVKMSGCNDCHTAGYTQRAGAVPEREWLKGDTLGWHGPWGTTYPINLRLLASRLDENQWLDYVRNSKARPPMPWWVLQEMEEQDVRAIYSFIRSLPVEGDEAPQALKPGVTPKTAYFQLVVPKDQPISQE